MRLHHPLAVALILLVGAPAPADDKVDPAKLKDKVSVAIGKNLAVRFEQAGDKLTRPKVLAEADDKSPTPSFSFRPMGDTLFLTTKNPYPRDLQFRALARLKGRKDYFETSIVPVKSGLFGIEVWQDPIEELILFDFKLVGGKG